MLFSPQNKDQKIEGTLLDIKQFIETVAAGDFTSHIDLKDKKISDDLSVVVSSLNSMSDRLHELFIFMNTNIKEKSDELSHKVDELNKSNHAILNLLEDIDGEKKRAESMVVVRTKELSDERSRLLASINSLSWGFVIASTDNTILLKNPVLTAIVETENEIKSFADISKLFEGIDLLTLAKQCVDEKKVIELKEVLHKKKYLRITFSPVLDVASIIGYVFLAEDITEAKIMERSRDEFFAVASHELRTPLTSIRGNTEMILDMFADKITDKEVKEMLNDISQSSIRLIDIVNDFLEVSRLEQGKVEIKFETFNTKDLLKKVVRDLQSRLIAGVTLTIKDPEAVIPDVRADKGKIEQILINLIGNSVKFTAKGSILVSTDVIDKFLKISVTDTGLGISEANQLRLFRKFQQAGEQMLARDVTQGTGLGLYISQLLTSKMGGSIGVEKSVLGVGSTFAFTIPIAN